jgi:hypothetical protein
LEPGADDKVEQQIIETVLVAIDASWAERPKLGADSLDLLSAGGRDGQGNRGPAFGPGGRAVFGPIIGADRAPTLSAMHDMARGYGGGQQDGNDGELCLPCPSPSLHATPEH